MSDQLELTSLKPYLLRAHYEWMVDNGLTPQLLVDAAVQGVSVPQEFVRDGAIVLNIAPRAVVGLTLGNDLIEFSARFSGRSVAVSIPQSGVRALFAREAELGITFPQETSDTDAEGHAGPEGEAEGGGDDDPQPPSPPGGGRPSLRVVK